MQTPVMDETHINCHFAVTIQTMESCNESTNSSVQNQHRNDLDRT